MLRKDQIYLGNPRLKKANVKIEYTKEQIKELAYIVDVMIIIGSFTSANSKRLTMLSLNINTNTYQVSGSEEINSSWFENCDSVGISAGASTPDYLIHQVKDKIEKIGLKI